MEPRSSERVTLEQLRAFTAIAREEGVSAAARALGVSKSTVSRQLSALEAAVGVELIERGARATKLTGAGAIFYERALEVLAGVEGAVEAAHSDEVVVRGRIRVTAPSEYGAFEVVDALAAFARDHDALDLDVELTDRRVDMEAERVDVSIRTGALDANTPHARRVATIESFLVASPGYLSAHGEPAHPDALSRHAALVRGAPGEIWSLARGGERVDHAPANIRLRTNGWSSALAAARAGLGVALLPDFIVADALASGELVRVLDTWSIPRRPVWAVLPRAAALPAATRALVEHLSAVL
jgi:DNA-binding transcriptional LysR family regulator